MTKMAELKSTLMLMPMKRHSGFLNLMASCTTWICCDTAESWSSLRRLNSSKQPHAPQRTRPMMMRPIDLKSMPSSQLKTSTCRPSVAPSILTDSVLPVPEM